MRFVRDGWQIQIEVVVAFLINSGVYMNISFTIKAKFSVLIKWSCRSPIKLIIELRRILMIIIF